jgi:hypothetical protein
MPFPIRRTEPQSFGAAVRARSNEAEIGQLSSTAESVMGSGVDHEFLDFIVTTACRIQLVNANSRR